MKRIFLGITVVVLLVCFAIYQKSEYIFIADYEMAACERCNFYNVIGTNGPDVRGGSIALYGEEGRLGSLAESALSERSVCFKANKKIRFPVFDLESDLESYHLTEHLDLGVCRKWLS